MSEAEDLWDRDVAECKAEANIVLMNWYVNTSTTVSPWILAEALRQIAEELDVEGDEIAEEVDTDIAFRKIVESNYEDGGEAGGSE